MVDNRTGIDVYISCSCFLNQHSQSISVSLGGQVLSTALFLASLILSVWYPQQGDIHLIGTRLGLHEFAVLNLGWRFMEMNFFERLASVLPKKKKKKNHLTCSVFLKLKGLVSG